MAGARPQYFVKWEFIWQSAYSSSSEKWVCYQIPDTFSYNHHEVYARAMVHREEVFPFQWIFIDFRENCQEHYWKIREKSLKFHEMFTETCSGDTSKLFFPWTTLWTDTPGHRSYAYKFIKVVHSMLFQLIRESYRILASISTISQFLFTG